jgi:hypothetical protein
MIANGYHRTMPCPFSRRKDCCSTHTATCISAENSEPIGNVLNEHRRGAVLQGREPGTPRRSQKPRVSDVPEPLAMVNVGAMKQVVAVRAVSRTRLPSEARPRTAAARGAGGTLTFVTRPRRSTKPGGRMRPIPSREDN